MPSPNDRRLKIRLRSQQPSQILAGLEVGLQRDLLADVKMQLELEIDPAHPELLVGLDLWLQQGLIDEVSVRQLCQQSLTCLLPQPPATVEVPSLTLVPLQVATTVAPPQSPSWLQQRWQSLQAELSLQWLLFLGVFMVVVSSGVLAASQWEQFPPAGQYSVLLAYTLCFWGVSEWAQRQDNLPLTTRTLRRVALLLLPVNFWAMDGFALGSSGLGIGVSLVATLILSYLIFRIGKTRDSSLLLSCGYGVLSYLHWGWGFAGIPVIAVYLGVGIVLGLTGWRREAIGLSPLWLYGLGILFGRAVFLAGVDLSQLGLAIGASGAWLWWQGRERLAKYLGGVWLGIGWLVSVGQPAPWQAVMVSLLGLGIVWQRLKRLWQVQDLIGVLLIGGQLLWLGWRLLPTAVQREIFNLLMTLGQAEANPYSLWGVVGFLYLLLVVGLSDWLYHQRQSRLGSLGENIALGLGLCLIGISFVNPWLRTIAFLNSTITVAVVCQRRQQLLFLQRDAAGTRLRLLIYLTHCFGLATLLSGIHFLFPTLSFLRWGILLVTLALGEWGLSLIPLKPHQSLIWRDSAWYLGLGLGGCSYVLLASEVTLWRIFWLDVPIALTVVAMSSVKSRRQLSAWLSTLGLVAIQLWLLQLAFHLFSPLVALLGFGVGGIVMAVNTAVLNAWSRRQVSAARRDLGGHTHDRNQRQVQTLISALITVGFGLGFGGVGLAQILPQTLPTLFLIAGATLVGLWLLHHQLRHRHGRLANAYAKAVDGWGILVCSLALLLFTLHSFFVYWGILSASGLILLAGGATLGAIAWRTLPRPSFWGIWALGWNVEIMTAEAVGLIESDVINLAIANLVLGLGIQCLGDWWQRHQQTQLSRYWHVMPLLYSSLGAALRWGTFTRWTGLLTLTLAITFLGVGRRREALKPLLYLALVGISVSAYEALFYQFSLSPGGAVGDGLILMAALGTGIVYAYRLLWSWLRDYLHLSRQALNLFAHIHWLGSSLLLIVASFYPIESTMTVGLVTGILLIQYAIFQGRNPPHTLVGEAWVYAGFLEAVGLRLYWLSLPLAVLLESLAMWKGAFASLIAYFLYILPWDTWGWTKRPWRIAALIIPIGAMLETPSNLHPLSYLFVAAFYLVPTLLQHQIRYTYISVVILVWLAYQQIQVYGFSDPLWYALPLGLAMLYFAQFDPLFQDRRERPLRHFWRCCGVGIIGFAAFLGHLETGIVPGILALITLLVGLALRIRAFLYVGTIIFLLNATYQLGILIFEYPFTKWMIGLLVGIGLIWLAATFETRREQIKSLVQHWFRELESWE